MEYRAVPVTVFGAEAPPKTPLVAPFTQESSVWLPLSSLLAVHNWLCCLHVYPVPY